MSKIPFYGRVAAELIFWGCSKCLFTAAGRPKKFFERSKCPFTTTFTVSNRTKSWCVGGVPE